MEVLLTFVIGFLYAAGIYMMLRRSMVKLIIGLILLSHATNLLIFTASRLTRGSPPIIDIKTKILTEPVSDPVSQALILTAIVIGFGIQAFAIVLFKRIYAVSRNDDVDELRSTDILTGESGINKK